MFKNFLQKIKQSQNKVLLGIFGAVTISGLAYLAYITFARREKGSHIENPSDYDPKETIQTKEEFKFSPSNEDLAKSLIKVVNNVKNAVKNSHDFAFEAVKAIYQGYHELSFKDFQRLARQSRKFRRECMQNLPKYKQILFDYEQQIQAARNKALTSILEYFKLEMRQWLVLVQKYADECRQPWEQIVILTDVRQLGSLRAPSSTPIHPQIMIQIFEYKNEVFEQILQAASSLFEERTSSELYNFIDRRLSDMVFKQFGTEDEDIFFSMVVVDPRTKQRIQQLEQQINARLEFFVSGPYQ